VITRGINDLWQAVLLKWEPFTVYCYRHLFPSKVISSNEKKILQTSYNHLKIFVASKLRKGDHVRISKYEHVFEKGYTPNYTTEIFKIRKVEEYIP